MPKIEPDILRKSQLVMLDGLICLDAICQKHGLKYWLDSGTLLGAVRHKGFIPWDDDIDISMPLEDYLTFMEVAQAELKDGMFLQTTKTDPQFAFDYMKIRSDKATIIEFHEEGKDIKYHQGVFVDIFPMLAIRDTPFHKLFYKFSFSAIRFFSAKHYQNNLLRGLFVRALRSLHMGWERNNTNIIYGGEMPDVAASFDKDSIFPLQRSAFEEYEFYTPHKSSDYLKQLYSFNFMELPPENKRTIHAAAMRIEK